jgi:hypothetical protein
MMALLLPLVDRVYPRLTFFTDLPKFWIERQEGAGNLGFLLGVQEGIPLSQQGSEGGAGGKKASARKGKYQ